MLRGRSIYYYYYYYTSAVRLWIGFLTHDEASSTPGYIYERKQQQYYNDDDGITTIIMIIITTITIIIDNSASRARLWASPPPLRRVEPNVKSLRPQIAGIEHWNVLLLLLLPIVSNYFRRNCTDLVVAVDQLGTRRIKNC